MAALAEDVHERDPFDPRCAAFYRQALACLDRARVPYLVGGAFAMQHYAGIARFTKDLDLFLRPSHIDAALEALASLGCETELTAEHWLGKAYKGDILVDLIFSSGNGVGTVDDQWFMHAVRARLFGRPVLLVPAEEMIWQKAYIMERERFDGADVLHILEQGAERIDWERLLRRFGEHWHVLLAHLVLFTFAYPTERQRIPRAVMRDLLDRLEEEGEWDGDRITRATLLSRHQYAVDVRERGYKDARLLPPADLPPHVIEDLFAADDAAQESAR